MSALSNFVYGIVGTSIGFFGGASLVKYCHEPVKVTLSDVNKDGRDDYVIERQVALPFVLIQQPDGTYKNIEEHLRSLGEKSEIKLENEKSLIEKIVSGLK